MKNAEEDRLIAFEEDGIHVGELRGLERDYGPCEAVHRCLLVVVAFESQWH